MINYIYKATIIVVAVLLSSTNILFAQNLALTATSAHSGGGATGSPDYSAANYNDNSISTCGTTPWGWVTSNGWIEYTWTTPQLIASVVFFKDNRPMTSCTIEYWNGSSYTTAMSYSNSVTCEDSVNLPTPITTTKIRFNNIAGSSNPNHREIRVWGVPCSTKVTQQPVASTTLCEEKDLVLSIAAQDVATYRWQIDNGNGFVDLSNGGNISGATSATLSITNVQASLNNSVFRCMVAKSVCMDSSNTSKLRVDALLDIDSIKASDTTCLTATKDLFVKGTGAIQSYQWQVFVNGQGFIDVPFAPPYVFMGNVLRISGVPDTLDGARFRCIVNGICDTLTTAETRLTVEPIPSVGESPEDAVVTQGTTHYFEVKATAAGARYQWQVAAPGTHFVNINNGGLYEGVRTSVLSVKGVSRAHDGYMFRCVVMSKEMCNSPGDTSDIAILTVPPGVSVQNVNDGSAVVLYPNPANGDDLFISIDNINTRQLTYRISDKTGRVMADGSITGSKTHVDVSRLPSGLYIVQVAEGNTVIAQSKFTKL